MSLQCFLWPRWVVLAAGCFVSGNAFSTVLIFGSLFVPLLDKFREDRATTAIVQSLFIAVTNCSGVVWSMLSRRFGLSKLVLAGSWLMSFGFIVSFFATSILQLTILIGFVSGCGVSIMYVGSSIAIQRAFDGRTKRVALALHQLCVGLGCLGYPFLMDYLVNTYQISGTLLIIAGINLNNIAVALVIYHANKPDQETKETVDIQNGDIVAVGDEAVKKNHDSLFSKLIIYLKTISSLMLTFRLGAMVIATSVSIAALYGFLVIVLDMFASKGFTSKQVLDSFTAFNTGQVLGKIIPVILQLKSRLDPIIICIASCCCGCVGQVFIEVFSDVYLVYVGSGLSGLSIGAIISGSIVALLNTVPPGIFDEAFGITMSAIGIISVATGPFYGWLRDDRHTYTVGTIVTASLLALSALLFLCTLRSGKSRDTYQCKGVEIVQDQKQIAESPQF